MLSDMERNRRVILTELASISFYMQGSVSFDDSHLLSTEQRLAMSKVIEKHFEAMNGTKGSKLIG